MSGLWHISQQQVLNNDGTPSPGSLAYFYQAATLTPITVYQDYALGVPWNQPVVADGYGRFPAVYLDDSVSSFYRHRVTDADGLELISLIVMPIIGTGGGGGGGSPVDPSALFITGDTFWQPANTTRSGCVRANARTIGNAVSGATERANADCAALFAFLWLNLSDTVCPVSGGRGASAVADFGANKRIGLPDLRGRGLFGLDDMGNTAIGRITAATFAPSGVVPGASGGVQNVTLSTAQLPAHTHTVANTTTVQSGAGAANIHTNGTAVASGSQGSGSAVTTISPGMLGTWFIKL
jgi:hypothetical protein